MEYYLTISNCSTYRSDALVNKYNIDRGVADSILLKYYHDGYCMYSNSKYTDYNLSKKSFNAINIYNNNSTVAASFVKYIRYYDVLNDINKFVTNSSIDNATIFNSKTFDIKFNNGLVYNSEIRFVKYIIEYVLKAFRQTDNISYSRSVIMKYVNKAFINNTDTFSLLSYIKTPKDKESNIILNDKYSQYDYEVKYTPIKIDISKQLDNFKTKYTAKQVITNFSNHKVYDILNHTFVKGLVDVDSLKLIYSLNKFNRYNPTFDINEYRAYSKPKQVITDVTNNIKIDTFSYVRNARKVFAHINDYFIVSSVLSVDSSKLNNGYKNRYKNTFYNAVALVYNKNNITNSYRDITTATSHIYVFDNIKLANEFNNNIPKVSTAYAKVKKYEPVYQYLDTAKANIIKSRLNSNIYKNIFDTLIMNMKVINITDRILSGFRKTYDIFEYQHGLSKYDIVYADSTGYYRKALAVNDSYMAIGIVIDVVNDNEFTLMTYGKIDNTFNIPHSESSILYLSDTEEGKFTTYENITNKFYTPIGYLCGNYIIINMLDSTNNDIMTPYDNSNAIYNALQTQGLNNSDILAIANEVMSKDGAAKA